MWKVFTHDYRSPIQGGEPVWDGTLPFTLPKVELDTSEEECGAGWNFCKDLATAFTISGLWPTGRPSVAIQVEPLGHWINRGNKCRADQLRLVRLATDAEITAGIESLSESFGKHQQRMIDSQLKWRKALRRPDRDPDRIPALLEDALHVRNLNWTVVRYPSARATWATWAARAARDAWDAGDAGAARAAWAARPTRAASRDAGSALTWEYAALRGWANGDPLKLTVGVRDAYRHGLEIVLPTGPNELGWVMAEERRKP